LVGGDRGLGGLVGGDRGLGGLVGGDRGLGGLVVDGCAGFRGPGWPNGPPSRRLAPGGFYENGTGSERSEVPVPLLIEAPRREPGGTAGRWAVPAPGSPRTRPPPTRPIRDPRHATPDSRHRPPGPVRPARVRSRHFGGPIGGRSRTGRLRRSHRCESIPTVADTDAATFSRPEA